MAGQGMADQNRIRITEELESLKTGDSRAWDVFFNQHDSLIRSVVAWTKWRFQAHTCDDIAQQVRVDLTRAIPTFRGESSLANFVKRICVRRCIDQVRREVRHRGLFASDTFVGDDEETKQIEFPAGPEFDPVHVILRAEQAKALASLIDQLDELCRTAIRQFYVEDLSYVEIAQRNGITVNTVGSRLSKCLNKLRGLFKKKESGCSGE